MARSRRDATFEAHNWLRSSRNPSAFASNHFDTTTRAIRFVVDLYTAGGGIESGRIAVWVTEVFDEPWRLQEEGGPYSATMLVQIVDRRVAAAVVRRIKKERPDTLQEIRPGVLRLWWD